MANKQTLKEILPQLKSWCAVNNISVQSVYDSCHGMTLQELVYYLFGVVKDAVEDVVKYEGDFKELYDYVHDYFDNLDVQDEINKKLDDMYANGELGDLINDLISEKGIGNREYDWTKSGYTPNEHLSTGSFIDNQITRNPTSGNEGVAPNVIYQGLFNYTDDDATANENFKYPINALFDATMTGHSANTKEASTQNYSSVLSFVKHNVAGIVGTCCFGARLYTPSVDEVPEIAQFGGNKCAVYDGHVFNDTEYEHGGYVLGAEFGVYDRVTKGTAPVYLNNDFGAFTRRTSVINVAGGGHTQPITEGIRIMKFGSGQCGMWNGIYLGSTAFDFGQESGYYPGTVGINMAGWRSSRGGADIGIKFAGANRHLEFVSGANIASQTSNLIGRANGSGVSLRILAGGADSTLYFSQSEDVTVRGTVKRTDIGLIGYSKSQNGIRIQGQGVPIKLICNVDNTLHGLYVDSANVRPMIDNDQQLGSESFAWNNVVSHHMEILANGYLKVGDTTLNETQLKSLLALI